MPDAFHQWGCDLVASSSGDLGSVSGPLLGQQRILRRLLTNPGDYIWQLDYGAGLGQFIGQPVDPLRIQAIVRGQIFKESAVAPQPEPIIDVQIQPGGNASTVYLSIQYVDAESGETQVLSFSVPS